MALFVINHKLLKNHQYNPLYLMSRCMKVKFKLSLYRTNISYEMMYFNLSIQTEPSKTFSLAMTCFS